MRIKKLFKKVLLLSSMIWFASCSTLFELSDSNRANDHYVATRNNKGEEVYLSQTPVSSYAYTNSNDYSSSDNSSIKQTSQNHLNKNENIEIESYSKSDSKLNGKVFIEMAKDHDQTHLGLHYGFLLDNKQIMPRVGVSIFSSGEHFFFGFDGSFRYYLTQSDFKPFIGLGVYVGDTKKCRVEYNIYSDEYEVCEKKFLNAGYGEIGIEYKGYQFFVRDYNITRAGINIPSDKAIGVGLVF